MKTAQTYAAAVLFAVVASAPAQSAGAGSVLPPAAVAGHSAIDWDTAFTDGSGNMPVHFVATYVDVRGTHRLEEWRVGRTHLRRITDARIDLHADSAGSGRAGQPLEYVWQILDLKTKIDHRITTHGMLRLGMLYSYYSMAHVLSRPAGEFTVRPFPASGPAQWQGQPTSSYLIEAKGQASTKICWLPRVGVPLRMERQTGAGWETTFSMQQLETRPISPAVFTVATTGFRIRNVDDDASED